MACYRLFFTNLRIRGHDDLLIYPLAVFSDSFSLSIYLSQVRIIAAQALTTMAIRSGEPYRIQIYEFLHALAQGGVQSQFSDMHISNGEDQGASGTGLGSLLSPMLKVLDDMYSAQDDLIKCA